MLVGSRHAFPVLIRRQHSRVSQNCPSRDHIRSGVCSTGRPYAREVPSSILRWRLSVRNVACKIMKQPALSCSCHCMVNTIREGEEGGHGVRRVISVVCVADQAGVARLLLARMCDTLGKVRGCSDLRDMILLSV